MPPKSKARVFLSYAHENLDTVKKVYFGLKERGLNVWFDKTDLGPGLWKRKIEKAIPKCRYFIICISEAALNKIGDETPGFQDEELQQAYEIARVQPEDSFTIVPVRLECCDRGDHRLSPYQQYDLFEDFEARLDHLAVNLGGTSLSDKLAEDTRTEDEKIIASLLSKGTTFYYAGEFEKSLDVFSSLIALKPDFAEAWYNKSIALGRLYRYEESFLASDKALEIKPDYAEVWHSKGYSLGLNGRTEDAIDAFEKALEIKPNFGEAWTGKAYFLSALGRSEEALYAYTKALKVKPHCADTWNKIGLFFLKHEMYEDALNSFEKSLEIAPDVFDPLIGKAAVLEKFDRKEEYEACFNKCKQLGKNYFK